MCPLQTFLCTTDRRVVPCSRTILHILTPCTSSPDTSSETGWLSTLKRCKTAQTPRSLLTDTIFHGTFAVFAPLRGLVVQNPATTTPTNTSLSSNRFRCFECNHDAVWAPCGIQRALAGNLLITAFKFLVYLHNGSSAMGSEAIHSLVDSANQGLLLVGLKSASMAPDKMHQYGHGAFFP